jgi:exosome complex exonuclease DIS3/RRP44
MQVIYTKKHLIADDQLIENKENKQNKLQEINNYLLEDILLINPEINSLELVSHSKEIIYGILQLSSNVTYSGRKKFLPILDKYNLEMFSSSKKLLTQDIYVGVKIKEINKNKIISELVNYVGLVGDLEVEKQVILQMAQSNWKNFKLKNLKEILDTDLSFDSRIDLTHLDIFSIDPINCLDIDDALNIEILENKINIGIHIADVSSYILENSDLDKELLNRSETIYLDDFQRNMLDNLIVEQCSLFENKLRRAFSILLEIDLITNKITNITFAKSIIQVKNNFSYEDNNKYSEQVIIVSNIINDIKKYYNTKINNTHDGIAIFMILANNLVAEYLYDNINTKALLRKTDNYFDNLNLELDLPDRVLNKMKIYNFDKAEYCLANENSLHHHLGSIRYTHFTSPIRRYADIIVHRQLYNILSNQELNNISYKTIYNLNKIHDKYKKCNFLMQEIIKINNIKEKYGNVFDISGYIINYEEESNCFDIYIEELDLLTRTKLYPDKFELINKSFIKNKIILSYNDNSIFYEIYTKVRLRISITFNNIQKIHSSIIEPDFNLLFN